MRSTKGTISSLTPVPKSIQSDQPKVTDFRPFWWDSVKHPGETNSFSTLPRHASKDEIEAILKEMGYSDKGKSKLLCKEDLEAFLAQGCNYQTIAEKTGLTKKAVIQRAQRYGLSNEIFANSIAALS